MVCSMIASSLWRQSSRCVFRHGRRHFHPTAIAAAGISGTDYNTIAEDYHEIKENPLKKYSEEFTVAKLVGDIKGLSVLDLACGDGYYTRKFGNLGAKHVLGVDLSAEMVARAKAQDANLTNVAYRVGDASCIEDETNPNSFDLVTAVYLLQYAPNEEALRGMMQAASDNVTADGMALFVTQNPNVTDSQLQAQLEHYGVEIQLSADRKDGTPAKTIIPFPGGGALTLEHFHWTTSTIEKNLAMVGFETFVWCNMEVEAAGMGKYGAEFWKPYLDYDAGTSIVVIECRKKKG